MAAAVSAPRLPAGELHLRSGPGQTSLIELYSSEGCSSCPPAERWLGDLRSAPGLWRDFVPVAFHVDYWNRLGWPDRFSTPQFTQRQSALARGFPSASVYTPCFVRDGAEWRPAKLPAAPAATSGPGVLEVTVSDQRTCRIEFSPVATTSTAMKTAFEVHVAVLGGGFVSKVTRGENRGETLPQEFVALALADHPLAPENGSHHAEFSLPPPAIADAPRRALAIWITRRGDLTPLQATGGWLVP